MQKIICILYCFTFWTALSFGQIIEEDEEPIILYRVETVETPDSFKIYFSVAQQAISKKYYIKLTLADLHQQNHGLPFACFSLRGINALQ